MAAVQRAVAAVVEAAEEQEVALVLTRWRLARLLRRPPSGFASGRSVPECATCTGGVESPERLYARAPASALVGAFPPLMEISPRTHAFTHTFPSTGPPFS